MGKDKEKKEKGDKEKKEKGDKEKDKKEKTDKPSLVKTDSTASLDLAEMDHRKLFKEGQKFLTPPVADATRAFYESLFEENPDSKIAVRWCVEFGVFPLEKHKTLLKRYNHLKDKGAFSMQAQIKKALEKKMLKSMAKKSGGKDAKEKKK